jgi:hypothetical protein
VSPCIRLSESLTCSVDSTLRVSRCRLPARWRQFYPSSASGDETFIVMLLVLLAAFLWTYVLAVFCEVATNAHPANTLFNQRLDGLNAFIKHNEVCLWIACGHAPLP